MSVYEEEGGIALITWLLEETFFFAFLKKEWFSM